MPAQNPAQNPAPQPPGLANLKASFAAYSGRITRQTNRFDKVKTLPPTPTSLATVQRYLKGAEDAFAKMEDLAVAIIDIDATVLDDYEQRLLTDSNRVDDLNQAVGDYLHAAAAAPAVPAVVPPPVAPQQQIKVVQDLKPSKLSLDCTPSEFHLWIESFKAYFSASHLERLDPDVQHAFVYACIDADLHKRISPSVQTTTPVFDGADGTISVVELLQDVFLNRYPLVQRRFEFFQYPHSAGQLASAWLAELRMRGDAADLDDLTIDELFAYRVITGVRDSDLQDELLKLKTPSLKDVEAAILLYEAKLSTKAKTSLNRVQSQSQSRSQSGASRQSARPFKETSSSGSASGSRCGRCNRNHATRNCTLSSTIPCHQCGRRGHIAPACRSVSARVLVEEAIHSEDVPEEQPPAVSIRVLDVPNRPTPRIKLKFSQRETQFSFLVLPDTGATRTVVAYNLVQKYGLDMEACQQAILVANGDRIRCSGRIVLQATFEDLQIQVDALVTPDIVSEILLSWHDMQSLKILSEVFPLPVIRSLVPMPQLNKLLDSYVDVLSDTLGSRCLEGPPMRIHLRDDVPISPFKIYTTRQIPLHLQSEADAAVQRALDDGVICRETEPTDWCCRGGFVPKPNGKLRLITDFIPLNKFVLRPIHPFPSALDIVQSVSPTSTVFAVFDCTMGYFQVPLDEESSKLTTFLLPQGRFRYKRAPMGLSASSDEFCRRSDAALVGLEGVRKLVDDILIQAPDVGTLFHRLKCLFNRCRENGLTLSKRKAQLSLSPKDPPVKFAGFLISARGVQPDPDKVSSLENFPTPGSVSELRSFLGLVNQLGFFLPDLAHLTTRMRQLLKKGVAYVWSDEMEADFQAVKNILASDLVVRPFDPALKTQLLTDASRTGLGFALVQIGLNGHPRLIHCGSRALIPAETRYAIIELECLAITYAMTKCDYYLRGLPTFTLITDHRPLVGLFEKSLTDVSNPRIQRFREKVASYTFQIDWIPGKTNNIADALSRAPYFQPDPTDCSLVRSMYSRDSDLQIRSLEQAVCEDSDYCKVVDTLLNGHKLHTLCTGHPARNFSNVWDRLSVSQGLLVLDGLRLVPPASKRGEILQRLHAPHLGLVRTRKQAQQLYYWPGINNQIKMMIESCSVCQMLQPSQASEPQLHCRAQFPMENVSADLFEYGGKHYLLMVDRFSGFLCVDILRTRDTATVIKLLHDWFLTYGFPVRIRTDGGPQFRSEFDVYCKEFDIVHDLSSPMHPEANGHAESNVKLAKYLLIKCLKAGEDFRYALLELQNTPREDGFSPAQLFFGRRQRTRLPCVPEHFSLRVDVSAGSRARERGHIAKRGKVGVEDGVRTLSRLLVGQKILMQDVRTKRWLDEGTILSSSDTGRSYWIRLKTGKMLWRNRKLLRPIGTLVLSAARSPNGSPTSRNPTSRNPLEEKPNDAATRRALRIQPRINYRTNRSYTRRNK